MTPYGGSQPMITVNQVPEGSITITITSPVPDCNFSVSSPYFTITKMGPKSARFVMGPYSNSNLQGVTVTVTPTSGCFKATGFVFAKVFGYRLAYSPNPANEDLIITAIDTDQPDSGPPSTTAPSFEAELYDNHGKKIKSGKSEKSKIKLDVRDLPDGLYNLRAGKGKEAISEHISILH